MTVFGRIGARINAMFTGTGRPERIEAGNPGGRRLASIPSASVAVNTLIKAYGRTVIGRSRYLCTNNPYATAAKETFVSSLVGSGIKPSSLQQNKDWKKDLQELFLDWTDEADHDGVTDFYGLQALAAAELFEAGECFVRVINDPDNATVPFRLQLIPSEMLPYDAGTRSAVKGNTVDMGIEFNAKGRRVAYHFFKQHPLPFGGKQTAGTERVLAEEVMHLFRPLRAGQIRGLPQSVSSMARLAMLDLYDDAELERKRTTANFAAFVTKEPSEDEDDNPLGVTISGVAGGDNIAMEPGAIIDLNPGEDVKFSEPADVGTTYDPFQYRTLLQIASGFGVPYANMTGDLMRANYGSIRAGQVDHRRRITAYQHHVMVFQFCRPIWKLFLRLATIGGLTPWSPSEFMANERDISRVKWIPPKWDWVDPLKDRQAEALAVKEGFKSRDDVIEEEGYDPEEMDERIRASQERALALPAPITNGIEVAADDPDANPDGENDPEGDIRAAVERYGLGVRGGVITPQEEDEDFFRTMIGVPVAGTYVKDAWAKEKARRPVTLGASILSDPPPQQQQGFGGNSPHGEAEPSDEPTQESEE